MLAGGERRANTNVKPNGAAHLRAALAVCKYAIRSAEDCFGGMSSDARAILAALAARFPGEMPRTDITPRRVQRAPECRATRHRFEGTAKRRTGRLPRRANERSTPRTLESWEKSELRLSAVPAPRQRQSPCIVIAAVAKKDCTPYVRATMRGGD